MRDGYVFKDENNQPLRICAGCELSGDLHLFEGEEKSCELCDSVKEFTAGDLSHLFGVFRGQAIKSAREEEWRSAIEKPTPALIGAIVHHMKHGGEAPRFTLNEFAALCRKLADSFYYDPKTGERKIMNTGERFMLMVSELSEAFEGERKDKMDDHLPELPNAHVEMGDALIREFDFSGENKYDLDTAFWRKLEYNQRRADHKPENRVLPGGKKW
jgi:NTP pyrophosphatase (non-canonical NTP hydrolase)